MKLLKQKMGFQDAASGKFAPQPRFKGPADPEYDSQPGAVATTAQAKAAAAAQYTRTWSAKKLSQGYRESEMRVFASASRVVVDAGETARGVDFGLGRVGVLRKGTDRVAATDAGTGGHRVPFSSEQEVASLEVLCPPDRERNGVNSFGRMSLHDGDYPEEDHVGKEHSLGDQSRGPTTAISGEKQVEDFSEYVGSSAEICWLVPQSERLDKDFAEVHGVLARSGLDRFAALLQENGFDSMDILHGADDDVLAEIGMPASPRARLINLLRAESGREAREEGDNAAAISGDQRRECEVTTRDDTASSRSDVNEQESPSATITVGNFGLGERFLSSGAVGQHIWHTLGRAPPGWRTLSLEPLTCEQSGSGAAWRSSLGANALGGRVAEMRNAAAGPDEDEEDRKKEGGQPVVGEVKQDGSVASIEKQDCAAREDDDAAREILFFNEGSAASADVVDENTPLGLPEQRLGVAGLLEKLDEPGSRGTEIQEVANAPEENSSGSTLATASSVKMIPAITGTATSRLTTASSKVGGGATSSRPATTASRPGTGASRVCCFVCYRQVYEMDAFPQSVAEEQRASSEEEVGALGREDDLRSRSGALQAASASSISRTRRSHYFFCSVGCQAKEEEYSAAAQARRWEIEQRREKNRNWTLPLGLSLEEMEKATSHRY